MTKNQFFLSIAVALITLIYVVVHFYIGPREITIIGPSDTTQLPAQVSKTIIYKKDGKKLCTRVDPATQCEVGIVCPGELGVGNPTDYISLKELLGIKTDSEDPIVSIEGQACATFDINLDHPKNPYRCSGGRCYWR